MIENHETEWRKLLYQQYQDSKRITFQLQGDYGKWLIASLLLIHGAAVIFLAQDNELSTGVLPQVFWWHIAGLMLALICGFTVWINWSLHFSLYNSVDPRMIVSNDFWPTWDARTNGWIGRTHFIAIAVGILSALCIVGASIAAYRHMVA